MSRITPADIEALTETFERSDWQTLQLDVDGFQLHLSKSAAAPPGVVSTEQAHATLMPEASKRPPPPAKTRTSDPPPPSPGANVPTGWITVRAPNLGTFYRAPKPGAAPFVEIGQQVDAKTELCLLEVMKLFTSVVAGATGIVREVLVADGAMVEHDQPLIVLEPT